MLESNKHLFAQLAKGSILSELGGFTNSTSDKDSMQYANILVLPDGFQ